MDLDAYTRFLCRYHVHGASLRLVSGKQSASVFTSVRDGMHTADASTFFRVASLTKMATSLLTLHLVSEGAFTLDAPVSDLLRLDVPALRGITLRHLLSHTSALRDIPAVDRVLLAGGTLEEVLRSPDVRVGDPGVFSYCNLGFGIIGCVLEKVTGTSIRSLFQDQLFSPLDMRATLDASTLRDDEIMPVTRILPYHPGHDVRKTALGKRPLDTPDPERHFGHTAGAMYTDAVSVEKLLSCIRTGTGASGTYLPDSLVEEMHRVHAVYGRRSPTLSYGLGLLFVQDPRLSPHRFLGHQGLAYGCVDGAFWEEHTGRTMIFLNGGCSEGRVGMLTCSNRDLISFACREMNRWPS
jgi:CubicO group peptidase (beta-lactamase class C family)